MSVAVTASPIPVVSDTVMDVALRNPVVSCNVQSLVFLSHERHCTGGSGSYRETMRQLLFINPTYHYLTRVTHHLFIPDTDA